MEDPGEVAVLRCRKCRKGFVDSTCLHQMGTEDGAAGRCNVWHMNVETLPEWILTAVHQAQWTVGKLNCQSCGARLGSFNFVNHTQCPCGQEATVHLSKSRVDHDHRRSFTVVRPRRTRRGGGPGCLEDKPGGCHSGPSRSDVRAGLLVGSQFCCSVAPRLNDESQPLPAHREALHQLTDSRATQSAPFGPSCSTFRRRSHLPGGRGRCEPARSAEALSQTSLDVDETEGETRSETEPAVSSHLLDGGVDGSSTCPSPLPRERASLLESEEQHRDNLLSPGATAWPEEASPLSLHQGMVVSHRSGGQYEQQGEEEEEEGWGSPSELQVQQPPPTGGYPASHRLSKTEKNRLKSQRRKQKRRERWFHNQLESVTGLLTDSEEEDREGYTCAVCLDVYFSPYSCQPCGHVFCEPCLRTLARNRPASTPCPLCRTLVSHTLFQKELHQTAKTLFPKVFHSRRQTFQKANCAKWPLPNCRKRFRIFWGYQRQAVPAGRRWTFSPAGFTLDALDLADMSGWLFDIDLVIIYIHSVNWILACLVLCFLIYFFFS